MIERYFLEYNNKNIQILIENKKYSFDLNSKQIINLKKIIDFYNSRTKTFKICALTNFGLNGDGNKLTFLLGFNSHAYGWMIDTSRFCDYYKLLITYKDYLKLKTFFFFFVNEVGIVDFDDNRVIMSDHEAKLFDEIMRKYYNQII